MSIVSGHIADASANLSARRARTTTPVVDNTAGDDHRRADDERCVFTATFTFSVDVTATWRRHHGNGTASAFTATTAQGVHGIDHGPTIQWCGDGGRGGGRGDGRTSATATRPRPIPFHLYRSSANTAPTAANNTVTTAEDRPYTFTAVDFGFMDADAGATLASVKIVTVPAAGTLALDGTAVVAARRRHQGPDRRRHAHLQARARCARRPLYDLHFQGERRHGRQRQRLHDDHRRDGRPRPRLHGAQLRRPAPDLDRNGDGGDAHSF